MMKLNLDLPCRDVTTDINNTTYKMEIDTCFILHKLVGHKKLAFHTSSNPGVHSDSLYIIPIKNGHSIYKLQTILNNSKELSNKKVIVRYADKHKI